MDETQDKRTSRREFFRGIGRSLALGGMGALAAVLAGRRRRPPADEQCINLGVCRGCSAFDGCGLPQALSARQARAGG